MRWTLGSELEHTGKTVPIGDVSHLKVWSVWAGDESVITGLTLADAEKICGSHNDDKSVTEDRLMQENRALRERLEQLALQAAADCL